jgi:hypothetical protein
VTDIDIEVRQLVYSRIKTYGASAGISIKYPNKPLDVRLLTSYLKIDLLNTEPETFVVSGTGSKHIWICQISVYIRADKGDVKGLRIVKEVAALFPLASRLEGVDRKYTIYTRPSPVSPIDMDGWFSTPVQFRIFAVQ